METIADPQSKKARRPASDYAEVWILVAIFAASLFWRFRHIPSDSGGLWIHAWSSVVWISAFSYAPKLLPIARRNFAMALPIPIIAMQCKHVFAAQDVLPFAIAGFVTLGCQQMIEKGKADRAKLVCVIFIPLALWMYASFSDMREMSKLRHFDARLVRLINLNPRIHRKRRCA